MTLQNVLLTVSIISFLVIAADLYLSQKFSRTIEDIKGWEAVTKWVQDRRLILGVLALVWLVSTGALCWTSLSPLYTRIAGSRSESRKYMESAVKYGKAKKYAEAALELRNAIKLNPDDDEALLMLARILPQTGQGKEAVDSYRKVISLDPKQYNPRLELGFLAFAMQNIPLAQEEATEAARLEPDKPEPRLLLARIQSASGKREAALEQCRAILGKKFATPELRQQFIALLMGERAFAELLQAAEAGLKEAPRDTGLKCIRAIALGGVGRNVEAETVLRGAIAADTVSPGPCVALGDLLLQRGADGDALACYEEALRRDPDQYRAMNNVASLSARRGFDLDRSVALAARLRAKYPNDPDVADTLGWTLFLQGKSEAALPLLKQAVAQRPGPLCRYHLGAALLKSGNQAAGRKELEAALRLSGTFYGAEKARVLLTGKPDKS